MKKNKLKIINILIMVVIISSPLFMKIFNIPFSITLIMIVLWFLIFRLKLKIAWLVFPILILIDLYINKLLYFDLHGWKISFDMEQSFLAYPGISKSIIRYKLEGLWLPYTIRNMFYGSYLITFPWISGVAKLLSPLFWIRMLSFSGFSLLMLGIISYFKNKFKEWYVGWWFLIVVVVSALRVIGDSAMAVYLALPSIIFLILMGFKNDFFKKYYIYWYLLFLIDILLR